MFNIAKIFWGGGIKNAYFLPHMGTAPIVSGGMRSIDLMFPGKYDSFETLINKIKQSELEIGLKDVFFDMLDYMLADTDITIEEACRIVLKDKGIVYSPKDYAIILFHAKAVDVYVRMYYRDKVIREILEWGIDINVIGRNWDQSDFIDYPNFHWMTAIPFSDIFSYMSKSKIVLNVMPWFKAGSHERIFNTLLSGACPISDRSKWLERKFVDKVDIAYYNLNEIENLPALIMELLQNDVLREDIVSNGKEKVIQNYSVEKVMTEVMKKVISIYYP